MVGFRIATYSFPLKAFKPGAPASGLYDYKGLIHVHTNYSDGAGTVGEVAATGSRLGLDFLISTDHNTLQPLIDHKEGWYDHLLFLCGEEITMKDGYILALGASNATKGKDRESQPVVDEVQQHGGMAFISHPLHPRNKWRNWEITGTTGMEIIDAAGQWETANRLTLLWGLMTYPLNPSYAFLNLFQEPQDVLKKWDDLTQRERMVGIYSVDLHGQFRILKRYYIKFPSIETVMPIASNHILSNEAFTGDLAHDKKMVYDALRDGHLYFAMDLLGDPTGFLFQGTTGSGERVLMGDELNKSGPVTLTASLGEQFLPESYRIKLYKDGLPVAASPTSPLVYETAEKGAYRVEVELDRRSPFLISHTYAWIYSNPIYIQ